MSNSLNDLEKGDNESKDEEVTVKDIFEDDDDDEEAEIEILEYIDMVDEGYYTPSTLHLILLFCLVLLVSGGVGVLVYYAIEDRNEEESRSLPFPAPTVAPPTVPTEAPSGGFLCSICALGEVTLPDGVVDIVGQPKCSDLEAQGKTGAITEGQCGLLQAVTAEPCGCDQDAAKICTVCATGVVRDPDGVIDVSSAGFAGIDNVTCGQLDSFAQGGRIPVEFCPLLQEASVDTCKCGEGAATPDFCTVCSSGVVRNPAGILNVTAAGFPEIDTITCGALVTFEEARSIPIEFCPALQEASLEECDCGPEFVCSICGPSGIIRNPNGQIEFAGQTVTCANLEVITASGQIQESQCPGLQALASTPCDCGVAEGGQAILDLLSTVVGDAVYASNTSEYLAAQFLISEDPRYNQVRRRMEPLTLLQEEYPSGSNGTSVPELPPAGPEAQSNITEDLFPVTISVPDASTNSTDDAVAFDANVTMSDDPNERPDNTETNTTVTSSVIPLSDMEDSAIIQRYLLILLYFQTTENRASPWMTSCAAAGATQTRRGLQDLSECTFRNNETAAKWLSEALECEWAGVSCSPATGEVVALQLNGLGLMGDLPTQLLALPSLAAIDFSSNNLTGIVPNAYVSSNSSNLQSLNLANNTFRGSLPRIENGATLRALNLSYNLLESALQIAASASALTFLDVSNNALTGDLSSVGRAESLVLLDITNNEFKGNLSNATELFTLDRLKTLRLGANSFLGTLPSAIASLTNLEVLELYQTNMTGSIPTEISLLTKLKILDVSESSLNGALPSEIGLLTSLETMMLFDNLFTGTIPSEVANMSSLQIVNLGQNEFIGDVPVGVCNLVSQNTLSTFGVDCEEVTCECCVCCMNKQCDDDGAMIL